MNVPIYQHPFVVSLVDHARHCAYPCKARLYTCAVDRGCEPSPHGAAMPLLQTLPLAALGQIHDDEGHILSAEILSAQVAAFPI